MSESIVNIFRFESQDIRFIDGKPVANDVATVLGYADPASTVSKKVFPENRTVAKTATVDGKYRDITVLEEAGIYQLIFSSKLESAKRFQQWVFSEVLPSIRKTGSYIVPQKPKLPAYVEAVEISRAINEITDNLGDNPRLAQFLIDHAISEIMPANTTLTGDRLMGVVEIAEKLGYQPKPTIRSQLGKFVKSQCEDLASYEERLVNGTFRKVACYPENHERVIKAIGAFFA